MRQAELVLEVLLHHSRPVGAAVHCAQSPTLKTKFAPSCPTHRHCHDNMIQFCCKAVPVMCTPVSHGIFLTLITCNMADGSIPRALSEDLNYI